MRGDRWRCERWLEGYGPYRWVVYQPGHCADFGLHGPSCDCYPFSTWREAFAYADRMARADR